MLRLTVVIGILLAVTSNASQYGGGGGGGFPPQQPQYPPQQQQQYGQQQQQDPYGNQQGQGRPQQQQPPSYPQQYGMQSPPPPPQGQYSPPPPQGYGGGALTPYGKGPPPPQGQENSAGIFARFKSGLVAAGQALTGGPDLQGLGPPSYPGMQGQGPGLRRYPPPGPGQSQGPGPNPFRGGPPPPPQGQQMQQQQQQQNRGPPGARPFAPPLPGMYPPPRGTPAPQTPPPPQYNQGQGQYSPPPPPQYPPPAPQYPPNPFSTPERELESEYPPPPAYPYDEPQIIDSPGQNVPPPPPRPGMQQQQDQYPDSLYGASQYQGDMPQMIQQQEERRQPQHLCIPAEPSVFVVDDCIVLVLRPQEFLRKKLSLMQGGAGSMQVFSDFEHVLTHTRVAGVRTVGSGELLECAQNVLSPASVAQLRAVAADFALVEEADMDDAHFEEFTARCQSIVAREGGLHIASVAPATRDLAPRLGLKDGWKEALTVLATAGVPTFVFSSGHGDVISQAFLQGGLGADSGPRAPPTGAQTLPQNLRIISNFFRTAPDGSVRAFSQPIVHERNKNATTASRHMGMPVPDRPHALVFGSHEDDLLMTEGAAGLREQISVGFLEMADDLAQRLPNFLTTFDAVVLGDSSFSFGRSLLEEVLQVPPSPSRAAPKGKQSLLERLNMGGLSPDIF